MTDISLLGVSIGYDDKTILSDIYLRIPANETMLVAGKSGLGKSSLAALLLKLVKPQKGQIIGLDKKISAVFQEDRLIAHYNAVENVRFACPHAEPGEIIADLVRLGFDEKDTKKPASCLSGGMQRRVALLRALHFGGDMLILDEAFKGLDAKNKALAIDMVKASPIPCKLIISHEESEWKAFCKKPLFLETARLPFLLKGEVVHGKGMGKRLGFATANIDLGEETCYLPFGVYACRITLASGLQRSGILNHGRQPSLPSGKIACEVHIFDFDEDIYGQQADIVYERFIRPEKNFADKEALIAQVKSDIAQAKQALQEACIIFPR